jgi:hypothetical protein
MNFLRFCNVMQHTSNPSTNRLFAEKSIYQFGSVEHSVTVQNRD